MMNADLEGCRYSLWPWCPLNPMCDVGDVFVFALGLDYLGLWVFFVKMVCYLCRYWDLCIPCVQPKTANLAGSMCFMSP